MKSISFIAFAFLLAFACQVSAQDNPFPNELDGFEFFGNGKLKGLMIAVSTKEDVKKVFGSDCSQDCNYDENWRVSFSYFGDGSVLKFKDKIASPKEEFNDKIWSVVFVPKKMVSSRSMVFSKTFKSFIGRAEFCDSLGKCGRGPKLRFYEDSDGLSYSICKQSVKDCNKDDLNSIRYDLTKELENKIFYISAK